MGNLASADFLYGIPSLPSILSHVSGMMGSGPWAVGLATAVIARLARGLHGTAMARVLSETWH
jgi:hypothetical protein